LFTHFRKVRLMPLLLLRRSWYTLGMGVKYCLHLLLGLIICPLAATAAVAAPSSQFAEGEIYVVQVEDGLGNLAEKYYNDATLYWIIVQATNAQTETDHTFARLETPFNLEIGQKLWIPPPDTLTRPTLTSHTPILSQVAEIGMPADRLIFSPDDKLLVLNSWASGGDKLVQVRDTATWDLRWETNPGDWAQAAAFSPGGQQLSISIAGGSCLCQAATGETMVQLQAGSGAVYGVVFSSDGQRLVGVSSDGKLIIWDASTNQPIAEFKPDLPIAYFMLSPNGPWLAAMTAGSWGPVELIVWDILSHERRTLVELKELPNHSNAVFSPDTRWLAASLGYGAPVTIWETQTWPEVVQLEKPPGSIRQLTFSSDGRWLAGVVFNGEMDNKVLIWAVPTWQVVAQLDMADVVQTIVFSPDSHWLAAGLGQGIEHPPAYEGQLWEVATGKLLARMPHQGQVQAVTFSHNGQWLATGSIDRTVRIWAMPR
jgi:WD40 repeat protein